MSTELVMHDNHKSEYTEQLAMFGSMPYMKSCVLLLWNSLSVHCKNYVMVGLIKKPTAP